MLVVLKEKLTTFSFSFSLLTTNYIRSTRSDFATACLHHQLYFQTKLEKNWVLPGLPLTYDLYRSSKDCKLLQASVYSLLQAAIEISSRGDGRDKDINIFVHRR